MIPKKGLTPGSIAKRFNTIRQRIDLLIVRELQLLGEKCVNICRDLDTYQDDTGNLRSSIGYIIYVNYERFAESFEQRPGKGSTTGAEGKAQAENIATQLAASLVSNYYSLIIVAGMDYAEEVEARNYAVLTPAQHFAESEIPKLKARIIRSFNKA